MGLDSRRRLWDGKEGGVEGCRGRGEADMSCVLSAVGMSSELVSQRARSWMTHIWEQRLGKPSDLTKTS